MKTEKIISPLNGYSILVFTLVLAAITVYGLLYNNILLGVGASVLIFLLSRGFIVVSPNSSKVLLLFGDYKGTVKQSGFFWINPLLNRTSLSLRARNFESEKIYQNFFFQFSK